MNMTVEQIIGMVNNAHSLSVEEKEAFVQMLKIGEPYPEEFLDTLERFLEEEENVLSREEDGLKNELEEKKQELLENYKGDMSKKKKVLLEGRELFQREAQKLETELNNISAKHDTEIEEIVHEQGEQAEIDDIHDFLDEEPSQAA